MIRIARADLSELHVVIPLRGAGSGKSRLGFALDAEERQELVLGMLWHTLQAISEWPAARRTHIVTGDHDTARLVRRARTEVNIVGESHVGGLNAALRAARDAAAVEGATAVLFLPADLPLLSHAALDELIDAADAALAAGSGGPLVVAAAADARGGTNALLLSPSDVIEPHFGEASLEAHLRAAAAADASLQVVVNPALGFDLDTLDDLERLDTERVVLLEALGQALLSGQLDEVAAAAEAG